jgi:hypothetical protein
MRHALKLHPDSHGMAVTGIAVDVVRPHPGTLVLRYEVTGEIGGLLLPPLSVPSRMDGLWQHTCFEAFLRPAEDPGYYEFNFAPSTHWAAYRFERYRSGMSASSQSGTPRIETRSAATYFELQATLTLDGLRAAPIHLGLSAVIEEMGGHKSYWALTHPPGKADFHHADCFAVELPRA